MGKRRVKPATEAGRRSRTWWWVGLGVLALGAGFWAVRSQAGQAAARAERMAYAPVTGPVMLPVSMSGASDELKAIYEFAARRPDVERYLPCFCGCWRAGHKSNYDCFVDELRADGVVDIDEMGFT